MLIKRNVVIIACLIIVCCAGLVNGTDVKPVEPAKVALIGFRVDSSLDKSLADKLRLLIFAQISMTDKLVMLERKHLKKIMQEHDLSMSGLVSAKSQLRLGLLAGANFVLSGRVYQMNNKLYINAKVINSKTTRVFGLFKSYPKSRALDDSLEEFAKAITRKLIKKLQKNNGRSTKK
jgi:TolB-like protein